MIRWACQRLLLNLVLWEELGEQATIDIERAFVGQLLLIQLLRSRKIVLKIPWIKFNFDCKFLCFIKCLQNCLSLWNCHQTLSTEYFLAKIQLQFQIYKSFFSHQALIPHWHNFRTPPSKQKIQSGKASMEMKKSRRCSMRRASQCKMLLWRKTLSNFYWSNLAQSFIAKNYANNENKSSRHGSVAQFTKLNRL